MNEFLANVLSTGRLPDAEGVPRPITGTGLIDPAEGEMMAKLIRRQKTSSALEIGCGLSSLYIADAMSTGRQAEELRFAVCDIRVAACQANMARAGFGFVDFHEGPSQLTLPKLAEAGRSFDFVFIDGHHRFGEAFVDFYFTDRLLRRDGIMVFDDVSLPGVHKLVRHICNYPNYRIIDSVPIPAAYKGTASRRALESAKRAGSLLARLFPEQAAREFFNDMVVRTNRALFGGRISMIALQKRGADVRSPYWHQEF